MKKKNDKTSDFDVIWHTAAHLELDDSEATKNEDFKNSRSWTTAISRIIFWS